MSRAQNGSLPLQISAFGTVGVSGREAAGIVSNATESRAGTKRRIMAERDLSEESSRWLLLNPGRPLLQPEGGGGGGATLTGDCRNRQLRLFTGGQIGYACEPGLLHIGANRGQCGKCDTG